MSDENPDEKEKEEINRLIEATRKEWLRALRNPRISEQWKKMRKATDKVFKRKYDA
jgi:hypothetical protein